jgi:hypothetical protein
MSDVFPSRARVRRSELHAKQLGHEGRVKGGGTTRRGKAIPFFVLTYVAYNRTCTKTHVHRMKNQITIVILLIVLFVDSAKLSLIWRQALILLSLEFMYRTSEIFCSVRWALLLLALLEWADARTGRGEFSWFVPGMHSFLLFACYWKAFSWCNSNTFHVVGFAQDGTIIVQLYDVHSHGRRLPGRHDR